MDSQIIEFDPTTASSGLLAKYFDLSEKLLREMDPQDPLPSRELLNARITDSSPGRQTFRWLVLADVGKSQAVVGTSSIEFVTEQEPDYKENKHIATIHIDVDPDFRRQGLGTRLLRVLVDKAVERGEITTFETFSFLEPGWSFCAKFGGMVALEAAQSRLELADVDWEMIERWQAHGRKRNESKGIVIKTFDRVPENIMDEFVDTYNYTINQVPLGGLEMRSRVTPESLREAEKQVHESGARWYTKATQETDGKISGLTEIIYYPGMPHRVEQELTGVRAEYRGRGLGKWLKADMLLFVRDTLPGVKYINTGNADSNAPMLSINQRMGFKRYQTEICYKFELERLNSMLG
jgi:mycothiol synthase